MTDKTKKRKTIAAKSIASMLVLGAFLFLGTIAAAGYQMYRMNLESYEKYTQSYARLIADNVPGGLLEEALDSNQEYSTDSFVSVEWLLYTAIEYGSFRNAYLIVPQEDGLLYLVDFYWTDSMTEMDLGEELYGHQMAYKEKRAYMEGEKEAFLPLMTGENDVSSLLIGLHSNSKEKLATAAARVTGGDGIPVALVGLDVPVDRIYESVRRLILNVFFAVAFILAAGIAIYYRTVRRQLIEPVTALETATKNLVDHLGSEEPFTVEVHTGDEIESLAASFEEMDRSLRQYIQENTAFTSEKEHLRTELSLAARIQEAMLPGDFPAFPERKDFDIYAMMKPAREVGGDFYDFFLIDEDHLALVIADVSGKGIPASLFMMVTENMVCNYTKAGQSPKEVLTSVNESICANNTEEMFVTLWMGILDLNTGLLKAANAGHEYPVLKKPDGAFELYKDKHGFVAGGMEDAVYHEYEIQLEKGSILFLYTDGLPEATDINDNLFGNERMLEALNQGRSDIPEHVLKDITGAVDRFAANAPQFDDMTLLCAAYYGKEA